MVKSRVLYLLFIIGAVIFYYFYEKYISLLFLIMVFSLPIVFYIINIIATFRIKVSFEYDEKSDFGLKLNLDNKSFLPINLSKVYIETKNNFNDKVIKEIVVIPIAGRNITQVNLSILSKYCGNVEITVTEIKIYDMLSLFSCTKRVHLTKNVPIFPQIHKIKNEKSFSTVAYLESNVYSETKKGDDSSQIFDYHEYDNQDKMKDIHWKLSSKLDKLMVKEYSIPIASPVLLVMELEKEEEKMDIISSIDILVKASYSIANYFNENQITLDVLYYMDRYNEMKKFTLKKTDDKNDMLISLFDCKSYVFPNILYDLQSINERNRYSNIIYMTTNLKEDYFPYIIDLKRNCDISVIYVEQENKKISENILTENEIEVIKLNRKSLKNLSI